MKLGSSTAAGGAISGNFKELTVEYKLKRANTIAVKNAVPTIVL